VDFPNQAGQYPFVLTLDDHGVTTNAAYVTDTAGHVSLIAKSGMTTDLGTITQIDPGQSSGIGINTQGQIVLTAQIKGGPDALLLLTPKAP
jgi:hypothetical protein